MKKITFGTLALATLVAAASPAMAGHHHGKHGTHHKKGDMSETKKVAPGEGSPETADLNARSLQQAQTPVPAAPAAVPGTTTPVAPSTESTMPANAPTPN